MSRARRRTGTVGRRAVVPATALALGAALTGCGAGPDAAARQYYGAGYGGTADAGTLRALNALVVVSEDGPGVVSLGVSDRGSDGDELVAVTYGDGQQAEVIGQTEVAPNGLVLYGGPDADGQVLLPDFDEPAGTSTELVLRFADGGELRVNAPVVPQVDEYAEVVAPEPPAPPAPEVPPAPGTAPPGTAPSPATTPGTAPAPAAPPADASPAPEVPPAPPAPDATPATTG